MNWLFYPFIHNSTHMSIQLIIFDIAGTTARDDDFVAECLAKSLEKKGVIPDQEAVKLVMGIEKPVAIRQLLEKYRPPFPISPKVIREIHEDFLQLMIDFYQSDDRVEEIPGTSEMFSMLRQKGVKVALDTGFSRDIADVILDRLAWHDKIDASVCSDEVEHGRPAPDMGYKIMEMLGLDKENTVVAKVGDTLSDIGEGQALGCEYIIGVESGAFPKEELLAGGATHVVPSVKEVPGILFGERVC